MLTMVEELDWGLGLEKIGLRGEGMEMKMSRIPRNN